MSVGLLIITHERIGNELLKTANNMLVQCPLATAVLEVGTRDDPAQLTDVARGIATDLDHGQGVLVLTDAYGSTPSNIANNLGRNEQIQVVSGINLPMLIRVLNYPSLSLKEMTEKALSGGRDGIIHCDLVQG